MYFFNKFLLFMGIVCICTAYESTRQRAVPNAAVRNNWPATNGTRVEMMSHIYDRVSALTSLHEAERTKLDAIGNKLMEFGTSTNSQLQTIQAQQQETSKQLENLENMQHNVNIVLEEIRKELDQMRVPADKIEPSHVYPRQAAVSDSDNMDINSKLESLATFLTSTRVSVSKLENTLNEFGVNINKLTDLTRGTDKRLSIFLNRNNRNRNTPAYNPPQYPQVYNTYSAPGPVEPTSCAQATLSETGIQKLQLNPRTEPFYALCESADKGGWTVILNRFDGSINFNRDWNEYKLGFGNLAGEFFIGLDKLHAMTAASLHELMIVLVDFKNVTRSAKYNSFAVGSEKEFYPLQILGQYSGDAGDSFSHQAGNKFSTFDNDNDGWVEGSCAQAHTGAWWYAACEMSNLNGQYLKGPVQPAQEFQGMYWSDFHGSSYSLQSVQMKIRPIEARDAL